jgi:hypothetical protein
MPPPYASLFSPFRLVSRALRNRIVHASMNTHMAAAMRVTDLLIQYHAARALRGTDRHRADQHGRAPECELPGACLERRQFDGLEGWANAVESEDCWLLVLKAPSMLQPLPSVSDLRSAMRSVLDRPERGNSTAVLFDMDHVAFVAYSTPRMPKDRLQVPLRASGMEVHVIGDCALPRGILAATAKGHAIGNTV